MSGEFIFVNEQLRSYLNLEKQLLVAVSKHRQDGNYFLSFPE